MTHEELEEAVPLYAAGALERTERQALEAHLLSGCVSCHTALKEFQSVAAILPFGLNPTPPPRALKAKIMAARTPAALTEVAQDKAEVKPSLEPGEWMNHLFPPESASSPWSFGWALGIAAVAILTLGGYLAWTSYTRNVTGSAAVQQLQAASEDQTKKVAALQQQLEERERTIAQIKEELQQRTADSTDLKDQLIQREAELEDLKFQFASRGGAPPANRGPEDELAALLRAPNAKAVSLSGSDMAKQASGMLVFDARTKKAWLYAINLPECPSGTTYQLWAINDKPVSVGTFHMDSGETAHLLVSRVPEFSKAKKFAVSLEPTGGRPSPTGPIYLVSQS
ncbi:MAG: anti-sigma factor [Phycisphaerales bacterium]|nr:anti-sigma factor [Phycisphaerales bacterium]